MSILDVEDGIVLRRFDHLGEVEVQRRVRALGQHHEPDDILADFPHDVGESDEVARRASTSSPARRPRNRRTIWTSFTSRSTLPSVSAFTAAWTRLTVPAWSAPQMLTRWSAVLRLLQVISGVGAEIGPAAVRLLHRPVLVVAELGRTEQRQLDRLPFVVRIDALRPLERAFDRRAPCRAAPASRVRPRRCAAARLPTRTCRDGCRAGRDRAG